MKEGRGREGEDRVKEGRGREGRGQYTDNLLAKSVDVK